MVRIPRPAIETDMILVGLFLLATGFMLNVLLLRKASAAGMNPGEVLRTPPWLAALLLVVCGLVVMAIGGR